MLFVSFLLTTYTHTWEVVSTKLLSRDKKDSELAKHLTREIIEMCKSREVPYSMLDHSAKRVLDKVIKKYFDDCWPIVGKTLLDEKWLFTSNLAHMLGTGHEKERPEALVTELPEKAMFEWCGKNEPVGPAIMANITPVFSKEKGEVSWHPFARRLIDEYGHHKKVRSNLCANLFSFPSCGSRAPYYEKRIKFLSELTNHPCTEVRNWANSLIKEFETDKKEASIEAEEWEWGIH